MSVDFDLSKMAEDICADFVRDQEIHEQGSIVNFIKNDRWIRQVVCAVWLKLNPGKERE